MNNLMFREIHRHSRHAITVLEGVWQLLQLGARRLGFSENGKSLVSRRRRLQRQMRCSSKSQQKYSPCLLKRRKSQHIMLLRNLTLPYK